MFNLAKLDPESLGLQFRAKMDEYKITPRELAVELQAPLDGRFYAILKGSVGITATTLSKYAVAFHSLIQKRETT